MKRSVLLSLVLCIPIILLGQQEKKAIDQPLSEEINALQTAANLVQYGYSESSPLALIEAARIIGTTPKQSFTFELAEDKAKVDNVTKDNVVSYDPEELLASAENLAGKDKTGEVFFQIFNNLFMFDIGGIVISSFDSDRRCEKPGGQPAG